MSCYVFKHTHTYTHTYTDRQTDTHRDRDTKGDKDRDRVRETEKKNFFLNENNLMKLQGLWSQIEPNKVNDISYYISYMHIYTWCMVCT